MKTKLERLYEAKRAALQAEAQVLDCDDEAELGRALSQAVADASAMSDRTERGFRMQVLADALAKVDHPEGCRGLLRVLDDADASVAARAASALAAVAARGRYPELVHAVQGMLDSRSLSRALVALPGLLLDLAADDPVPVDLLVLLLDHDDADVAAEAACALAELEEPGVVPLLESFADDERPLSDAAAGPSTMGALVRDLLATLGLEEALPPASEA